MKLTFHFWFRSDTNTALFSIMFLPVQESDKLSISLLCQEVTA